MTFQRQAISRKVEPSAAARRGLSVERAAGVSIRLRPGLAALHKGDPCFPTPEHIRNAEHAAMRDGYTRYAPSQGDDELRAAIARRMSTRPAREWQAAEVLVTAGATEALYCALTAYLDPGDEALVFDPTYSLYAPIIRQTGAEPVSVGMTPQFRLDPERLRRAVTSKTKLMIVTTPANPTGVVFTREELEELANVAMRAGILVVADEVYDRITFGCEHVSVLELPQLQDRLIYVNSFSKTYAMTGWRLGWVAALAGLLEPVSTIHGNVITTVHAATQRAGIAALLDTQDPVEEMLRGYGRRRAELIDGLRAIDGVRVIEPEGAFYVFAAVEGSVGRMRSSRLARDLLAHGVAVRSGTEYGAAGEGWIRLSYSADLDHIRRGVAILRQVVENHQ